MARKLQPIKCVSYVKQPDGTYRPLDDYSSEEREEFANQCVQRMGQALNNCFSCNLDEYLMLCESMGKH